MDSLQRVKVEESKPKIFPFNPNYITDFKGYQLGMSIDEIDKLLAFRKANKFVNSSKQFQQVTGINDSLLAEISIYFKFPDWVTQNKKVSKNTKTAVSSKKISKKDINKATVDDFKEIYGIGEKLAKRIVNYRNKLQGFSLNDQLYEVWNLKKDAADELLLNFEISSLPNIKKININDASFKEVLSIAYIDYELTKKIFNYRDEVAEIQSIEELKKIDGFPLEKFDRIALYLSAK